MRICPLQKTATLRQVLPWMEFTHIVVEEAYSILNRHFAQYAMSFVRITKKVLQRHKMINEELEKFSRRKIVERRVAADGTSKKTLEVESSGSPRMYEETR